MNIKEFTKLTYEKIEKLHPKKTSTEEERLSILKTQLSKKYNVDLKLLKDFNEVNEISDYLSILIETSIKRTNLN